MRVLLYAPVDLNLIDGSAIWCASVAQMLCHDPQIHVDLLLNATLKRTVNTAVLADQPRIRLLDPWQPADCHALRAARRKLKARLTPEQAYQRIIRLHEHEPYDLLVLRGGAICQLVAGEPRLAGRSWFYLTRHGANLETTHAIACCNGRVACQTPLLQEFLEGILGTAPQRYVPLPPMVPRVSGQASRAKRGGHKLCYVGKFEPDYMLTETLTAFDALRARFADAELVVAGDKFHDPGGSGAFERDLRTALTDTPGVVWHGGLPREEVGRLMAGCDLGVCWRSARYDDSLEMSTKALEYAAAGLPVLLNPSRINRLVFGEDYPLYVDTPASFVQRATAALEDDGLYARAAALAFDTCQGFTFAGVSRNLQPYLTPHRPAAAQPAELRRPRHLLFAGHDLKFCREIIEHFEHRADCVVRLDEWSGHSFHDERHSAARLRWADVVWCEWCLGNAVWYSARMRPTQRLLIRLHRQEITTEHPARVAWANVRHVIFIAPHVQQALLEKLGPALRDKQSLIYNTFDCDRFQLGKTAGSEFRLGLLGYCPKLKDPRLALEILKRLVTRDGRWQLVLTGQQPQDYEWLWVRPDERTYYQQLEAFIAGNSLERHLVRQDWTHDPSGWYADVGFILSCSTVEGSHQAVAEGMAAGCIPVVRRWPGAAELYPNGLLFDNPDEAATLILESAAADRRRALSNSARREARERFDVDIILPKLTELVLGPAADTRAQDGRPLHGVRGEALSAPDR